MKVGSVTTWSDRASGLSEEGVQAICSDVDFGLVLFEQFGYAVDHLKSEKYKIRINPQ